MAAAAKAGDIMKALCGGGGGGGRRGGEGKGGRCKSSFVRSSARSAATRVMEGVDAFDGLGCPRLLHLPTLTLPVTHPHIVLPPIPHPPSPFHSGDGFIAAFLFAILSNQTFHTGGWGGEQGALLYVFYYHEPGQVVYCNCKRHRKKEKKHSKRYPYPTAATASGCQAIALLP